MSRIHVSSDGREVAALVSALPAGRFVLGLSGSPGAGKTTLAAALAAAYGVPVVPMDGFHLPHADLETMGRLDAKGAPDTFDAEGYAALLASLHTGRTVLAPAFDHRLPDPHAGRDRGPGGGRVGGHRGQLPAARRAALAGRPRAGRRGLAPDPR